MAARDGVPDDASHPDQQRYLEAQEIYERICSPREHADVLVDNTDPRDPKIRRAAGPTIE
jgi:uridine kinase